MMGGGGIIGSFLDEGAIDEFIITVVRTFIHHQEVDIAFVADVVQGAEVRVIQTRDGLGLARKPRPAFRVGTE